jgi:glycerophosphoryl diester phosphodiesterase
MVGRRLRALPQVFSMTKGRRFALASSFAAILLCAAAWHHRAVVKGNLIALLDLPFERQAGSSPSPPVKATLVAHAGGAVRGLAYTNSREALDEHYASGYRVFELDFHWTSDGRPVAVHDWAEVSAQFGASPHVFSYGEYVAAPRRDGLHQLTFEDVREWLRTHRDAFVVTDTKADNLRLLRYLQADGGDILQQLIVQIYRMSELQAARRLAPRAVWLSVYKYSIPAWALSRISGVDAFVIPVKAYNKYRDQILMRSAHFYVHSVPARSVGETFRELPGIYGIYVD